MYLRSFAISDAQTILSWIKDKTAFRKWSADRYPVFPPKPEDMAAQYAAENIFPLLLSMVRATSWGISCCVIQSLQRLLFVWDLSS